MSKTKILLLTNCDSDNIGDQIIEASVISLIKGVMKNLDVPADSFMIASRPAGIISKKYMATGDESMLVKARELISGADILVFGGAPLFNYAYQDFYLRTIKTLELANEYGVPVIFSSIGIEPFDEKNPKCLALKEALALPCVRQITTRDDFESLKAYVEGTNTPIAHVSDPAVFADVVFRKDPDIQVENVSPERRRFFHLRRLLSHVPVPVSVKSRIKTALKKLLSSSSRQKSESLSRSDSVSLPDASGIGQIKPASPKDSKPLKRERVGLLVTRRGIFKDNGIDFSIDQQRQFWLSTIRDLTEKGYDVRLFTTGHFSDQVFLDILIREGSVPMSKAATVLNSPEELLSELKACSGIIAYRLHASITAFALGIPSIGLSWNFKVPDFYASVGYEDRALPPSQWKSEVVVPAIEAAMSTGVEKDELFLKSVYDTLFEGLKPLVAPSSVATPFSFEELKTELPKYPGTTTAGYQKKVRSKMRRMYVSIHS